MKEWNWSSWIINLRNPWNRAPLPLLSLDFTLGAQGSSRYFSHSSFPACSLFRNIKKTSVYWCLARVWQVLDSSILSEFLIKIYPWVSFSIFRVGSMKLVKSTELIIVSLSWAYDVPDRHHRKETHDNVTLHKKLMSKTSAGLLGSHKKFVVFFT